jgi:formylglycine-generating enzyme
MKPYAFLLPLLLATALLQAQTRKDYALFFPVATYGSGWTQLPNTLTDCNNIANDLRTEYGFEAAVWPDKNKKEIKTKLSELASRRYGPNDQLLLWFSMHGHFDEAGDAGCLCPAAAKLRDDDFDTWLLHTELRTLVTRIPCNHILIMLDACYSGTFGGNKGAPTPDWETPDCQTTIQNALRSKTRYYIASGGKERTPSVSQLAQKMRSALGGRYSGSDGILSLKEMLGVLSEAYPTPKDGGFSGDEGGSFVFVPKNGCGSPPPPPTDRDEAAYRYASLENTEEAYRFYLDSWANGRYRAEAQKNLDRLQEERVWKTALNGGTAAGFKGYNAAYCPGGQYCSEANEKINALDIPDDGLVLIRGGAFQMGSDDGEADEKPVHSVTVRDFYLGKYELTVAQFKTFVDATGYKTDAEKNDAGSYFWIDGKWELKPGTNWRHDAEGKLRPQNEYKHPVIHLSWNDATEYCKWLSQKNGKTYRLPTEAEWEYAAGNGSRHTKYSWGNGEPSGKNGGNVADESKRPGNGSSWDTKFDGYNDGYWYTAPIGSYNPNDFGLYDMTGNVWEWCSDWYGSDYYKNSPSNNPTGSATGSYRVQRGGSWLSNPQDCRVADRCNDAPGVRYYGTGFRLARTF